MVRLFRKKKKDKSTPSPVAAAAAHGGNGPTLVADGTAREGEPRRVAGQGVIIQKDFSSKKQEKKSDSRQSGAPPASVKAQEEAAVQDQWKMLWETLSPNLIDPVDVPAVCDELMNRTINLLSPTQVTLIQRKVRAVVRNFNDQAGEEAKAVARNQHLLNSTVWNRLFQKQETSLHLAIDNAYTLLLHLSSESLSSRAETVAKQMAETARVKLDVNHRTEQEASDIIMPQIPHNLGAQQLPNGITLQSVVFLIALAVRGNRQQKLQLLFYLCMDNLQQFLATHPAGGLPFWLLEVGQSNVVISLASLMHYHSHGHAFLPAHNDHPFVVAAAAGHGASPPVQQQKPVTVSTATVRRVLSALASQHSKNNNETVAAAGALDNSEPSATTTTTNVMRQIWQQSGDDDPLSSTQLFKTVETIPERSDWTIQDFNTWAAAAVDNVALDAVMYRLFAAGILPSPIMERKLVQQKWNEWQQMAMKTSSSAIFNTAVVWGGLGGWDGGGGLGHGVLYCIDKHWWDNWTAYVGLRGDRSVQKGSKQQQRPGDLSTERLLERKGADIPGSLGSYEVMKSGLHKNQDYVLIPPGVWNVLYEMYGGGPPLPRMVQIPQITRERDSSYVLIPPPDGSGESPRTVPTPPPRKFSKNDKSTSDEFVLIPPNAWDSLETKKGTGQNENDTDNLGVPKLPDSLSVVTHPWIIHCQLCVPQQPYRRGETGFMSIQIMAMPDQPLWRLFAEVLVRFPLQGNRAFGLTHGKCRLWKRTEPTGPERRVPRYGPWNLLCGNRQGSIPMSTHCEEVEHHYEEFLESWKKYADNASVDSAGLTDRDHIMLEVAVLNQRNELIWPREAAAKAQGVASKPTPTTAIKKSGGTSANLCLMPGFGACGLTNLGSSGWLSCVVQCLSYMPLLRSYLVSGQYKAAGDLNKGNPLGTNGVLLEELGNLLRSMWSARYGEMSPVSFRKQLGMLNAQFSEADQQDPNEFLQYILDVVHEDSNKVRKKPYVDALEDDWIERNSLCRVGDESWRRFLRRNRSIMADVAMGQRLNTVTCPECNFSSLDFSSFNELSIPIPVAKMMFQCTVIRRATPVNSPGVLNKQRKGDMQLRFTPATPRSSSEPPSESFVAEQYVISMSRLADSDDLKLEIEKMCGIAGNQLWLFQTEEVANKDADVKSILRSNMKLTPLNEKVGPCIHSTKKRAPTEDVSEPTLIVAFESTLRPRPLKRSEEEAGEALASVKGAKVHASKQEDILPTPTEEKEIRRNLENYGNEDECRLFDSDSLVLAKAVSRSLWPRNEDELKLGHRVDAKDQRGNWYKGSVIRITDEDGGTDTTASGYKKKVRVHFDGFVSKWDETYTMEHFKKGRVQPLHSHTAPNPKPTNILVYHSHTDRKTEKSMMFGLPFCLQFQNEWSSARAGAHILAQASRFFHPASTDDIRVQRLYENSQSAISDLIDLLVDYDREYIRLSLGISASDTEVGAQPFHNPTFDVTSLSAALTKKAAAFLSLLPFEIRVTPTGSAGATKKPTSDEEFSFPFALTLTIGNLMNARHMVVLQWQGPPPDKSVSPTNSLNAPVMYVPPRIMVDKASLEFLKTPQGSADTDLAACLSDFCKGSKLKLSDCWNCPRCKVYREGQQHMKLWRLPDIFTFQLRRFNQSARVREKILTQVDFPLTGLDLSDWLHDESPASNASNVYDLIGVINHYGGISGGALTAICKATACGKDGKEEVSHSFNGAGTNALEIQRQVARENKDAVAIAQSMAESAEPLWLQFEDEDVQPIPPHQVVSKQAYILIYRRRRITPSNIARYNTLE